MVASNSGKVLQLSQRKRMAKANAQASSAFQSKVKSSLFAGLVYITQIILNSYSHPILIGYPKLILYSITHSVA